MKLTTPLALPCGTVLPGRIVKAAMTEGLADDWGYATPELCRLYRAWSKNHNAGHVLITGNIQIDRRYVERPGNVAIEPDCPHAEKRLRLLKEFAAAAQQDGTKCLAQLSHAGRQSDIKVNLTSIGPSAIKAESFMPMAQPREMTAQEIDDVVARFANAAKVCKQAGFAGIQLHAAHGYLLSQFLSPRANHRQDKYGGTLEARSLLLFRVVNACREAVGSDYCIAVKLNSSDFQKGGFTEDESVEIARQLEQAGVDLLEVSGGTYEFFAMMLGPDGASSTQQREGYFLTFAEKIKASLKRMPLMVTGGFRSKQVMEAVLQSGACEFIGVGRPVCGEPDCVARMLKGQINELPRYEAPTDITWRQQCVTYVKTGKWIKPGAPQGSLVHNLVRIAKDEREVPRSKWNIAEDLQYVRDRAMEQAKTVQGMDESVVGTVFRAKPVAAAAPPPPSAASVVAVSKPGFKYATVAVVVMAATAVLAFYGAKQQQQQRKD